MIWVYYDVFISWWESADFSSLLQRVTSAEVRAECIVGSQIKAGLIDASKVRVFEEGG